MIFAKRQPSLVSEVILSRWVGRERSIRKSLELAEKPQLSTGNNNLAIFIRVVRSCTVDFWSVHWFVVFFLLIKILIAVYHKHDNVVPTTHRWRIHWTVVNTHQSVPGTPFSYTRRQWTSLVDWCVCQHYIMCNCFITKVISSISSSSSSSSS